MSEEKRCEQSTRQAWRELAEQFEALGKSLASAIRANLETEENRQRLQRLQEGLEDVAEDVTHAIKEATESPEGERLRQEIEKTAESARIAAERAFAEAQPEIVAALRRVREELDKLTRRLEQDR